MTTTEAALDRMAGNLRKENIHMEATNVLAGIEHGEHQALLGAGIRAWPVRRHHVEFRHRRARPPFCDRER